MAEIKDFGEKIGGAKKDLWRRRGLTVEELDDMNERDLLENVTKENVWGEPNYIRLVDELGMARENALLVKRIRDSLPAKINQYRGFTLKEVAEKYIEFINVVKSECEATLSIKDVESLMSRVLIKHGYRTDRTWTDKSKGVGALSEQKFISLINVKSSEYVRIMQEAMIQNFPYEYRKELHNAYISNYGSYGYTISIKGRGLLFTSSGESAKFFKTKEECYEYCKKQIREDIDILREKKKAKKGSSEKVQITPPQLEHINRDGIDYRNGRDIEPEELLKTFEFRGGEFGNWTNQNERQQYLNWTYDSLLDLAKVMNLPVKAMSFGGYDDMKLAIAFGARGSGSALAHYEPARVVINLTKMKGAGSLAHEMGHAFDDFLGNKVGCKDMLSRCLGYRYTHNNKRVTDAMRNVVETMQRKEQTKEEAFENLEKSYERYKKRLQSDIESIERAFNRPFYNRKREQVEVTETQSKEFEQIAYNVKNHFVDLDSLFDYYKTCRGRGIDKETRNQIENILRFTIASKQDVDKYKQTGEIEVRKKNTDFYTNSEKCESNGKAYWSTTHEMFARSFAAYVEDNLGFKSQYLVYGTSWNPPAPMVGVNPVGEEREAIKAAIGELLKVVREELFDGIGFAFRKPAHLMKPMKEEDKARIEELARKSRQLEEERERKELEQKKIEQERKRKELEERARQQLEQQKKLNEEKKAQIQKRIDEENARRSDKVVPKELNITAINSVDRIMCAKDLRDYLRDRESYCGSLQNVLKHFANSCTNKGVPVTLGTIPSGKGMGNSKAWCVSGGKIVLDSNAPIEKQLEGMIESITTALTKQLMPNGGINAEIIRQLAVYKLCKKFGLDVRTYCMTQEFENIARSPKLKNYIKYMEELLGHVLVQIGLK